MFGVSFIMTNNAFLLDYLTEAPASLAVERSLECDILSQQRFSPPILDLGCGDGLFASTVTEEIIDVGVDPNQRALKKAGQRGRYHELIQSCGSPPSSCRHRRPVQRECL